MNRKCTTGIFLSFVICAASSLCTPPAQAGPQLVCWPFDIGGAKSLPWGGSGWHDAKSDYDLNRLATDTLSILAGDSSVLVHMETLRRAAIYGAKNPQAARELLSRLFERMDVDKTSGRTDPMAMFDAGYFDEAYGQASSAEHSTAGVLKKFNGYDMVKQALARRGADAQMEFAAALVASAEGQSDAAKQHLTKAAANAPEDSLLAKNLVTHCHLFQIHADTLAGLRSQLVAAKS
jgi:hypothetical protein